MNVYTAHTPKLDLPRDTADVERELFAKALRRAIVARRLVEHPHYSGA